MSTFDRRSGDDAAAKSTLARTADDVKSKQAGDGGKGSSAAEGSTSSSAGSAGGGGSAVTAPMPALPKGWISATDNQAAWTTAM
jgi:hypothetical protein